MDSTEISGKIRAAIKAKLEELGAYADEELPDYIMVMVANKKSRQQMTEDLNLFLGKNAPIFTKWLHEVLERLSALSKGAKPKETPAPTDAAAPKDAKTSRAKDKDDGKKKDKKTSSSSSTVKSKDSGRSKEKDTKTKEAATRKSDENTAPTKALDDILHIHAPPEASEEPPVTRSLSRQREQPSKAAERVSKSPAQSARRPAERRRISRRTGFGAIGFNLIVAVALVAFDQDQIDRRHSRKKRL